VPSSALREINLNHLNPQTPTIPFPPTPIKGAVNDDYKRQARTIAFNLKDPQNPDFRAHVLSREAPAAELARMSAADMANKELAQWRKARAEEHDKEIVLDVEAAAKVGGGLRGLMKEVQCSAVQRAACSLTCAPPKSKLLTAVPHPDPSETPTHATTATQQTTTVLNRSSLGDPPRQNTGDTGSADRHSSGTRCDTPHHPSTH